MIIRNKTDKTIVVEYLDNQYEIDSMLEQSIEIDDNGILRCFQKVPSFRFCLGKHFLQGPVRNTWLFGPLLFLHFDSFITVSNEIKRIEITDKKYDSNLFYLYSTLLFNNKQADSYDYHNHSDKKRVQLFSFIFVLPIAIIAFLLAIGSIYGIISEFSFESIIIFLICLVPTIILFAIIKTLKKFFEFKNHFKEIMQKAKNVSIIKDSGWFVKCSETEI